MKRLSLPSKSRVLQIAWEFWNLIPEILFVILAVNYLYEVSLGRLGGKPDWQVSLSFNTFPYGGPVKLLLGLAAVIASVFRLIRWKPPSGVPAKLKQRLKNLDRGLIGQ